MKTEGSILLAKVDLQQAQIAGRLDVTPAIVSGWLSGKRRPSVVSRSAIEEVFAIPADAWDRAKPDAASQSIAAPASATATVTPTLPRASTMTAAEKVAAYEHIVDRCIEEVRNSPNAKESKVLELGRMLMHVRKLRGEEVQEVKVLRHPKWFELRTMIITALSPYPDAMRAVIDALESLNVEAA